MHPLHIMLERACPSAGLPSRCAASQAGSGARRSILSVLEFSLEKWVIKTINDLNKFCAPAALTFNYWAMKVT